jgi:hypothetical protein
MTSKILFICKARQFAYHSSDENTYSGGSKSSGLYNSVKFMVDMLNKAGVECKMVEVPDNNAIDKEVTAYKPTHVIIEALWVVPEKFDVLTKLHPTVKWLVRLHSDVPFIANEGIAIEWIAKYMTKTNVWVAANSQRIAEDLESLYGKAVPHLPNYYPIEDYGFPPVPVVPDHGNIFIRIIDVLLGRGHTKPVQPAIRTRLDIGCFGAIRPLKDQLIQAIAAMRFADLRGLPLYFHINGNRVEGKGDPILKNIRQLFASRPEHTLVEHDWMDHEEFVSFLKTIDVTMQVSFTETYNIVAADSIAAHTPVITSDEIVFVPAEFHADPTSANDMIKKLGYVYDGSREHIVHHNFECLVRDAEKAKSIWLRMFE